MVIPALPLTSGVAEEVYVPPVNTMLPVADAAPAPPLTFTDTGSAWLTRRFCEPGVTVTTGVARVTVTGALAEALL
jgi:hypothetical protein